MQISYIRSFSVLIYNQRENVLTQYCYNYFFNEWSKSVENQSIAVR